MQNTVLQQETEPQPSEPQETPPQQTAKPEDLQTLSAELFVGNALQSGILNAPRTRLPEGVLKVEINPVLLKNERKYQFAYHQQRKVTHRNLNAMEAQAELATLLTTQFKQATFHTQTGAVHLTLNKRNELAVRREKEKRRKGEEENQGTGDRGQGTEEIQLSIENQKSATDSSFILRPSSFPHDRPKNHILPEGEVVPFLVALGVMSADGKVVAAKRDKFRQINRFLEMVADVSELLLERARLRPEQLLRIVDFGCGKGYLTFALYHYLRNLRGLNISLLGVDLKQDVLEHLTKLATELEYTGLSFIVSDIKSVTLPTTNRASTRGLQPPTTIDMVVALHACDTATDDALAKAIGWNAQVILAAPCCQHELFSKIHNDALQPMLRHGIIRERLNALITDTLRAELLAARGYQVQMLEFVDAEHTPKNLLIRAVRRNDGENGANNAARQQTAQDSYAAFRDFWGVQPYMEQALKQALSNKSAFNTE